MSPNSPSNTSKKTIKTMKRKPPDKQMTLVTPKVKTRKFRADSSSDDQIDESTLSSESSPSSFQCVSPDSTVYTESAVMNQSIVKVLQFIYVKIIF
jgi:hypothetical protein